MTATLDSALDRPGAVDDLCRTVFESLTRSDQRRWATTYVRGLVQVPGRKSVRRICEHVAGTSTEQCLQQFVNQSPWNWAPVRRALGWTTESVLTPHAWALQEVEFPKRGNHSVGVATQYVPSARRTFNCQLGLAVWMAGAAGAVPANWRLMLPPSWDADAARRRQVRLPDQERHYLPWEHVLSAVDEMVEAWDLTPRPIVADRRHDPQIEALAHGLDERELCYAFRIADRTPVGRVIGRAQPIRAGELIRSAAAQRLTALPERSTARNATGRSTLVAHAIAPQVATARPGAMSRRPRRVLARWPRGRSQPGELWLTNLPVAPLPELLDLLDIPAQLATESQHLRRDCGLDHFEGRSYQGWQHHVTLASVAHAHRTFTQADPPPAC